MQEIMDEIKLAFENFCADAEAIIERSQEKEREELMAGTKEGGRKASITNRLKHGEDFYERIGRKGGQNGHTGGFASNPELAKIAGRKGGRLSRRGKALR